MYNTHTPTFPAVVALEAPAVVEPSEVQPLQLQVPDIARAVRDGIQRNLDASSDTHSNLPTRQTHKGVNEAMLGGLRWVQCRKTGKSAIHTYVQQRDKP
eukprot:scaffold199532_cov36-Prasinocladus_malaysianus.AAC.1